MIKKLKNKLKPFFRNWRLAKKYSGNSFYCPICNQNLKTFLPLSNIYKLNAETHGYKYFGKNEHVSLENYSCPICKSSDRDRLYAYYFKKFILPIKFEKSLLHIAPAWKLNDLFLKKYFKITTTDLMMEGVDIKMDIENMNSFEDNMFDYFICSHVLEHVNNPDKALKELYRILKPNGIGIIMAPIILELDHTIEDKNHTSEADRIKHYGQADHLRLFSKNDFIKRIDNANLKLKQYGIDDFGEDTFKKLGLKSTTILYVGMK